MIPLTPGLSVAVIALTGCSSSAPVHYHSLLAPPGPATSTGQRGLFVIELLAVGIPAQLDQAQLVVRNRDDSIGILNGERWAGPLADEIRSGLSAEITRDLDTQDIAGLARPAGKPVLRIKVQVRRLDAWLGQKVKMEADWSIGVADESGNARLTCRGRFDEPAAAGYQQLVQAQQRTIAALAARIAVDARNWERSRTSGCQANGRSLKKKGGVNPWPSMALRFQSRSRQRSSAFSSFCIQSRSRRTSGRWLTESTYFVMFLATIASVACCASCSGWLSTSVE